MAKRKKEKGRNYIVHTKKSGWKESGKQWSDVEKATGHVGSLAPLKAASHHRWKAGHGPYKLVGAALYTDLVGCNAARVLPPPTLHVDRYHRYGSERRIHDVRL